MFLNLLLACTSKTTPPADSAQPAEPVRVVTFGDVHGDASAARGALKLAGVLDDSDAWIGGTTTGHTRACTPRHSCAARGRREGGGHAGL